MINLSFSLSIHLSIHPLGPDVQTIVSFTKSLVKGLLNPTVLTKSTVLIFFAKKLRCKSDSQFLGKENAACLHIICLKI